LMTPTSVAERQYARSRPHLNESHPRLLLTSIIRRVSDTNGLCLSRQ
jgi:hypothetical protein